MERIIRTIRTNDFIANIGRASGGRTFIRVIHERTSIERIMVGIGERTTKDVIAELEASIVSELVSLRWVHDTEEKASS